MCVCVCVCVTEIERREREGERVREARESLRERENERVGGGEIGRESQSPIERMRVGDRKSQRERERK